MDKDGIVIDGYLGMLARVKRVLGDNGADDQDKTETVVITGEVLLAKPRIVAQFTKMLVFLVFP